MPTISMFYGIRITMNWDDRNPPHFHVEYGEYKAAILIEEGTALAGYLPGRQLKLVLAWCELHRDELMQNWALSQEGKPLYAINPLV